MVWTTPRTWVAGETVTAAIMNTHVRDNLRAIGDAWTSYTPTWTQTTSNPTLGNGTLSGARILAGKLVIVRVRLTIGSTTVLGTGNFEFAAPANSAVTAVEWGVGTAYINDASGGSFTRAVTLTTGNKLRIKAADGTNVSQTVPMTWATGDDLAFVATYESA